MKTEEIKEKVKFYFDNKKPIHIKLHSKTFYNGKINNISKNSFVLDDRFYGCIIIYYHEIKEVSPFKDKKRVRDD